MLPPQLGSPCREPWSISPEGGTGWIRAWHCSSPWSSATARLPCHATSSVPSEPRRDRTADPLPPTRTRTPHLLPMGFRGGQLIAVEQLALPAKAPGGLFAGHGSEALGGRVRRPADTAGISSGHA